MNKLISANYWFGCDWVFYEVGYLGLRTGQLSLACAVVYLWNTGYLRVTRPVVPRDSTHPRISGWHETGELGWLVRRVDEIHKTHAMVMNRCMQFCEVIGFVEFSWGPRHVELTLLGPILDPVEAHVHGPGLVGLDGVPRQTCCR